MTNATLRNTPQNKRWLWFHRFGSPAYFYSFAQRWTPYLSVLTVLLFAAGLYTGLVLAPPDYQMGDSYRIIYIHVPSAWMSMFTYVVMAVSGLIGLIWHTKLADAIARASAPVGASFTFCALVTGALWGKPMWGTYWVWDARLTSELVLLFLYFGYMALVNAIEDRRTASRAGAVLALVGLINIPIIHFSVEWWNTLHQSASVSRLDKPAIATSMLIPLLIMFLAFKSYYVVVLLSRVRCEILALERRTRWVRELVR